HGGRRRGDPAPIPPDRDDFVRFHSGRGPADVGRRGGRRQSAGHRYRGVRRHAGFDAARDSIRAGVLCAPGEHARTTEGARGSLVVDRAYSASTTTSSSPTRSGSTITSISAIFPSETLNLKAACGRPPGAHTAPTAPS